jgi:hypothetical protein
MRSFFFASLLLSALAFAQNIIPPGTVLPAELNSSLNTRKSKPGQLIRAKIMQDVPLPGKKKIRAGTRITGHVLSVRAANGAQPAELTLRFERLEFAHQSLPVRVHLRAMASVMEVEYAQVPPSGPDRGTPWSWTTRNLIGGGVAYGEGGPVAYGFDVVGRETADGVLAPVEPAAGAAISRPVAWNFFGARRSEPWSSCRGDVTGNNQPQALWLFSPDACGVYGINVAIAHTGRTEPIGQITLIAKHNNFNVESGSGLLLRVSGADAQ